MIRTGRRLCMFIANLRTKCERCCAPLWLPILNRLLGSPQAILSYHKLLIVENAATICIMAAHFAFFVLVAGQHMGLHELIPMVVILSIPLGLAGIRMVLLFRLKLDWKNMLSSLENDGRAIGERALIFLNSRQNQDQRMMTLFLIIWYGFFGPLWQARKAPCWQDHSGSEQVGLLCVAFRLSCINFVIVNLTILPVGLIAPFVVVRCWHNFQPLSHRGIPKKYLKQLPTSTYTAQEGWEHQDCVICLTEYEEGDTMRRLPCGHLYHAVCIDSWLNARPICPMRCPENLWSVVSSTPAEPCDSNSDSSIVSDALESEFPSSIWLSSEPVETAEFPEIAARGRGLGFETLRPMTFGAPLLGNEQEDTSQPPPDDIIRDEESGLNGVVLMSL